jgi:hypothetical protein
MERSFLKHFVQCNRSLVFKYQGDLYFFPENQRDKNKMIYYAHHRKCVTSHVLISPQDSINFLIYSILVKKKQYEHPATNYFYYFEFSHFIFL